MVQMNANELAVYLEDITDSEESPYRQAATMLRQQQAEIEELLQFIVERGETGQLIIWKAQEK
jgi:hypothetical protein